MANPELASQMALFLVDGKALLELVAADATASQSSPAPALAAAVAPPAPPVAQAHALKVRWGPVEVAHLSEILILRDGDRFSDEKWQCVADALGTGRTLGYVKQKAQQIKKAAAAAKEAGGLAVGADAVASGIHPTGVGLPSAPAQGGIKRQSAPRPSLPGMAPRKRLASHANKAEWAAKVDSQRRQQRRHDEWAARVEATEKAAAAAAKAAAAEADTDYDVSEILSIRNPFGTDSEFQVKWSTGEISWEPPTMLENCRDLVKAFLVEAIWPLKINITAPKIKKNKVTAPKIKKKVKKMKVKGTPSTPAPVCCTFYCLGLFSTASRSLR